MDPNDGLTLSVIGDTYRAVITAEQTGGAFAVIDMLVPPGGGPGPHAHAALQESFYVLAGEILVRTKQKSYTAKAGSFVSIPLGGVVHSFKNIAATTAHLLCMVVPAGLEALFKEIGQPVPAGTFLPAPQLGPAELKLLTQIVEKHGQKLFPPDYLD